MLIIAHWLSTLRMADRIITIEGGRVVEDGTHDVMRQKSCAMRYWFWVLLVSMVIGHAGHVKANGNGDFAECIMAYLQHDYDAALADCSRALESGDLSSSQTADALNARGLVYAYFTDDYDKAIQDYDQAIRLKPADANAYNNRGGAYFAKGEYDRAIQDFDQAIQLKPGDDSAYIGRASAYANRGEYGRAIQSFDQAIELDPNSHAPLLRAQVLFELARFADADEALEKFLNANPENAAGVLWLALARWRAGASVDAKPTAQAQRLDLNKWPGPVVRLFLGLSSRDAVQAGARDSDPRTARRQVCEATFYIAELDLVTGLTEAGKAGFQHTIDSCPKSHPFARVAKAELGRM